MDKDAGGVFSLFIQMQNEEIKNLADKIAHLISAESKNADLSSLRKSIDTINKRLDKIEIASSVSHSALIIPRSSHPSQDRFAIAEAIADTFFDVNSKEKACTFEPAERPCDHCSMCSSRGF